MEVWTHTKKATNAVLSVFAAFWCNNVYTGFYALLINSSTSNGLDDCKGLLRHDCF